MLENTLLFLNDCFFRCSKFCTNIPKNYSLLLRHIFFLWQILFLLSTFFSLISYSYFQQLLSCLFESHYIYLLLRILLQRLLLVNHFFQSTFLSLISCNRLYIFRYLCFLLVAILSLEEPQIAFYSYCGSCFILFIPCFASLNVCY